MNHFIKALTLFILVSTVACGQKKDRRAKLDILGRVNEISISPDDRIWLTTATGNLYYSENIDSDWHNGPALFQSNAELIFNQPHFERISFFNKDTAILTGYISADEKESAKNGIYLTQDGGRSWKLIDFGGDSWIYTACVDKNGNAWMGGSSGDIHFSQDFGQNWNVLKSPYNSSTRFNSIFMLNAREGISGALHNTIYTTTDNWKTSKKINTPLDQKKYTPDPQKIYSDHRIEKILRWNQWIVVNQEGHIFYSDATITNWKVFPVDLLDFEIDTESQKLFAVSDSSTLLSFSTPTDFQRLTNKPLSYFPIDMKVVNHTLYLVSNTCEISKVNEQGIVYSIPYTTDKKISTPGLVKQFKKLTWGFEEDQLYLAEDSQLDWYREDVLPFYVNDFTLLSDSLAILWDGKKKNYLYSLRDHSLVGYSHYTPLKSFLAFPVKSFSFNSGSRGCYHDTENVLSYERENDSLFTVSNRMVKTQDDLELLGFKNTVKSAALLDVLNAINSNPSSIPSIKDFKITEKDKKNYLTLVDEKLKSKTIDHFNTKKKINKEFYYTIPQLIDTLDSSILSPILNQQEHLRSTTSNWFKVEIVNQNNDTIFISRRHYVSTLPWNLPWKVTYKEMHFNCYNVELSRFINACLPDTFMGKDAFDNKLLLLEIADFLYNRE